MLDASFVEANLGQFDVVLLSQVLEHMLDPGQTAAYVARLLKPSGIAMIGVPQFRSWVSLVLGKRDRFVSPPEHLNYFTRKGLTELFAREGLSLCCMRTVSPVDPRRLARWIPVPILGPSIAWPLAHVLRLPDPLLGGLSLTSFFQKEHQQLQ